jgi:YVTN family beta-propeller protein
MKKLILTILLFFMGITMTFSTELPKNIQTKLKNDIPGVTIRFDGLVEYPDKTQYLPVFPMDLKKTDEAKIVLTYPTNKTLKDKPDMVLFDNDFAMLRIIKSQTHNPTIIFYNQMPLCVKRGLLPQDLLVPENLIIPEELEILLGNLSIPLEKLSDEFAYFEDFDRFFDPVKAQAQKKTEFLKLPSAFDKNLPCLAKKIIYAINYQANAVYLINADTGKVLKIIPLRSNPSGFIMTRDQRYLLVAMLGTSKLSVIDLNTNCVVKEIESGNLPTSIAVDKTKNIAYVANQNSSTISVVDLTNMDVTERIEASGNPSKMALSFDRKALIYSDALTEGVHKMVLGGDFVDDKFLFKIKNLSKALSFNDKIYLASRDKNYITVVDIGAEKPVVVNKIVVGEKPLDMAIIDSKLYVVNSVSDSLSVIDLNTDKNIKDIPLNTKGFPNKINLLDTSVRAIISTASNYEYVLVDLEKDTVVKKFPIDTIVNSIIVSQRH